MLFFLVCDIIENKEGDKLYLVEGSTMSYKIEGGTLPEEEAQAYVRMLRKKYPERIFKDITFKVDGDFVDVSYTYDVVPFDRIRRITGYLVGTLERFNDAKRAEESQRVKHNV